MISTYSLWIYVGFVVGLALYVFRSKRLGLGLRFPIFHVVLLVIGLFVGGRTFFILRYPDLLPAGIWGKFASLFDRRLGFDLYGGFIGATLVHVLFCRGTSRRAGAIADLIAPSILLVVAFGRIGCHFHGCCFGAPTNSVFSVAYCNESIPFEYFVASGIVDPNSHDCILLYPTQLMYVATALVVAAVGIAGFRVRPRNFSISALSLGLTSLLGIAIQQIRGDPSGLTVTVNGFYVACSLPFVIFSFVYPSEDL